MTVKDNTGFDRHGMTAQDGQVKSVSPTRAERGLRYMNVIIAIALAGVIAGCAINKNVVALKEPSQIRKICIKNNPRVLMKDGFLPELRSQLHQHNIETTVFDENIPEGCRYTMEYTANWAWDMAMYLTYMHLQIREQGNVIASAEYDARHGGGNMGKFGATASKMKPLIDEMLGK